jgi:type I restriction enzyme S subunit
MTAEEKWKTAPLGEWDIDIIDGDRSNNYPKEKDFVAQGVPFLNTTNIRDGSLDLSDLRFITTEKWVSIKKGRAKPNDILMTTRGTIGRVARFKGSYRAALINAQMLILRANPQVVCPDYLFYVLRSEGVQSLLRGFSSGSAQPQIPIRDLRCIPITFPPIDTQLRIASILCAYDDLIEVNRRRVAVLEEMARGLFEEWFVRFRFPGHESVATEETPDGPLPQGWTIQSVGDVSSYVGRGIAPKYDEGAATLVVGQKCIRAGRLSLDLARRQSKVPGGEKVVRAGDVLINSTGVGTLGRVAQAEGVPDGLTVDSHVTIVRPSAPDERDYLGLHLLRLQSVFEHLGAGSTGQTELSRVAVAAQMIVWAPADLRRLYGRIVRPMRSLVSDLMAHSGLLAASRDLLLPRLISGQLSVETAERQLEDAA